jgi:hypothetical protein
VGLKGKGEKKQKSSDDDKRLHKFSTQRGTAKPTLPDDTQPDTGALVQTF